MTTKEKILLVKLILKDIGENGHNGWLFNPDAEERAWKAQSLCKTIANELNDNRYLTLAKAITNYIDYGRRYGDWDGETFNQPFPKGHENMDELHNLNCRIHKDKSEEFQSIAEEYLTYPDYEFDDWDKII